jgi:hypothetical protein
MLGSITPLGERGRGSRWTVTVVAYVVGSVGAGALLGSALGWLGGLAPPPPTARLEALAVLIALGVALDARLAGARLPTVRRQVNEDWLARYRGWVYGVSFGFQLGLGVVTVVNLSAAYAWPGAAVLSSTVAGGALIGGTFGLVRALPLVATAHVRAPVQLARMHARLEAWDPRTRRAAVAVEAALAVVLVAAAVT